MNKIHYTFFFIILFFSGSIHAQEFTETIKAYFNENQEQYGLTHEDIAEIKISSHHFSNSTGADHVYAGQNYQGVEVFNAIANFAIVNSSVRHVNSEFIPLLSQKTNSTTPSLTPQTAIQKAAEHLDLDPSSELVLLKNIENDKYVFSNDNLSQENINVKLVFQPIENQTTLRLAWDLDIYLLDGSHWYSLRIDALNGELLSIHDWVTSCSFGTHDVSSHYHVSTQTESILFNNQSFSNALTPNDGSQYRVFPMPVESPNHGPDQLVIEPADPIASPLGWHKINPLVGPNYTSTRGNNVRARADLSGANTGLSTEGGLGLDFDFPFNLNQQPRGYTDGATTNLFYWNNILHDVLFHYGFDEASGNFQETNYSGLGLGGDSVNADAQDGGGMNNANFATPPEGLRPRMQMYLWSAPGPPPTPLTINNGALAGSYQVSGAAFGPGIPPFPITADLSIAIDNNAGPSTDPFDGCDTITNGSLLNGKIVVIRRGECQFSYKVLNAQNHGAIAVIIVNNNSSATFTMGAGNDGNSVTIPSVMIDQTTGESLIQAINSGNTINATLEDTGPYQKDGSLDNGIIAHEYGHGLSNRLTGGAFASGCLQNDEQMGEGWSDYLTLIFTMKEGDTPEKIRGIGTYVRGQSTNAKGIRPAPYSTSFTINNSTYGTTNNPGLSQPHGIGFVWATMLWDLTWALIDVYGFDPDIYQGSGGNNIALQLVVDGLKLQPCSPGFVDGRDAILAADDLANGGANKCLIWSVFANRGLGVSASQGSEDNRFDQVEAFDTPQECALSTPGQTFNNFSIFPNPSDGNITIQSRKDMGETNITIFDINGRMVFTIDVSMTNSVNIHAEGLKPGVYIMKLHGENYIHTTKLIIK